MNAYTLLKKPFFGRYQKPWIWPAEAEKERGGWRSVEMSNGRGGKLVALFKEAAEMPARGTVVCAHPMGVEAKGYFLKYGHAQLLLDGGYNVLLFDFNGFGESPDADLLYPDDVLSAARCARELAPGVPVVGLGVSFGSAWLACALGRPGHGLSGAVLECPFTTLDEYWIRYRLAYAVLKVSTVLMPKLLAKLRPVERVRELRDTQRLLFIYGGQDVVTPVSMGERLMVACPLPPERVALWVVPAAKHTRALTTAPEEYRKRVLDILNSATREGSGLAQQAHG